MTAPKNGMGFRWVHERFGTNMRMTEIQAAIGRLQLRKLDAWIATRRRNSDILRERLQRRSVLRIPVPSSDVHHAYYRFYVYLQPHGLKSAWSRDRIVDEMHARRAPCFGGSCSEIYLEKAFDGTGWRPAERLPVARELGETSLTFLVHPTLSSADVHQVCDVFEAVLDDAQR
jgi:dTDP-4-amino-4,6-dideoxygalactose transaminase